MLLPHGELDAGAVPSVVVTRLLLVWLQASWPLALVSLWLQEPLDAPVAEEIRLFVFVCPPRSTTDQSDGVVSGCAPVFATDA
jgi:hypothetical protein